MPFIIIIVKQKKQSHKDSICERKYGVHVCITERAIIYYTTQCLT